MSRINIVLIIFVFATSHVFSKTTDTELLRWESFLRGATQTVATSFDDHHAKLDNIDSQIQKRLESEPNSPVLWYLRALVEHGRSTAILRKMGVPYDKSIEEYKERRASYFSRAMELDKIYEPHLTASMYYGEAGYLPLDLKLEAYHRVIKFENFGEYPKMRDNVYGKMLSSLYDAGRYEEAIELVNQMTTDPKWLKIWKNPADEVQAMKGKITRFEQKIKEKDAADETNQTTKPEKMKTQSTEQQSAIKSEDDHKKGEDKKETNNNTVVVIGIVLVILLLVGFVIVKRKKK